MKHTNSRADLRRRPSSSSIASKGNGSCRFRLPPALHEQRSAPSSDVLDLLVDISRIDVSELASLGSCSKAFREAVDAVLLRRGRVLLPYAIEVAAGTADDGKSTSRKQRSGMALWLLAAVARARVCLSPAVVPSAAA
jgi:hypothetical protein